jgi:cobalamin biosynthesis Co2+ chelatase CbiK
MLRVPSPGKCILSDYFYNFLTCHCGSIAHYNKQGWVAIYPTVDALKAFFKKNEFGRRVLDDIPDWASDYKKTVQLIEKMLFPLENYVRSEITCQK